MANCTFFEFVQHLLRVLRLPSIKNSSDFTCETNSMYYYLLTEGPNLFQLLDFKSKHSTDMMTIPEKYLQQFIAQHSGFDDIEGLAKSVASLTVWTLPEISEEVLRELAPYTAKTLAAIVTHGVGYPCRVLEKPNLEIRPKMEGTVTDLVMTLEIDGLGPSGKSHSVKVTLGNFVSKYIAPGVHDFHINFEADDNLHCPFAKKLCDFFLDISCSSPLESIFYMMKDYCARRSLSLELAELQSGGLSPVFESDCPVDNVVTYALQEKPLCTLHLTTSQPVSDRPFDLYHSVEVLDVEGRILSSLYDKSIPDLFKQVNSSLMELGSR